MKLRKIYLHEWVAGGIALASCLSLAVVLAFHPVPDAQRLVQRALSNVFDLAKVQLSTAVGLAAAVAALSLWQGFRSRLAVQGRREAVARILRATIPLMLMIIFHQTIPIWQRVITLPEADSALISLDQRLFAGTDPSLWLQRLVTVPLTEYMRLAYLSWFIAFQGTIYLLALLRPPSHWKDMALGTVLTLAIGYVGYVLVPAVGPVHAMKAQFTVDLQGSLIGEVTSTVVDRFGVWRDAFPSIHAAISWLLLLYARRYLPKWFVPYLILVVSILFSTVYLRWHYVVDVLAGMAVASVAAWLAPRLIAAWDSRTEANRVPQTVSSM